jgi:hypothetical protein
MINYLAGVASGLVLVLGLAWLDRRGWRLRRRRPRRKVRKQVRKQVSRPAKVVPVRELQRLWAAPAPAPRWPSEVVVRAEMRRLTSRLAAAAEVAELHGFGPLLDSVLEDLDGRGAR